MSNVNEIKTRIKHKTDTLDNWIKNDPVLYSGELAIVKLDDNACRIKVGDGVSNFSQLDFVDSRINIGTLDNINTTDSLSIIKITENDYNNLVFKNQIDENTLYVIDSENLNAYDKPIHNVGNPELLFDAANKNYVDTLVNSTSAETLNQTKNYTDTLVNSISVETLTQANEYTDELCSSLSTAVDTFITDNNIIHNELSTNIENKIYISDEENGERFTDLSIIKITEHDYNALVSIGQLNKGVLYIVESENINAYGKTINNVGTPVLSSDAVNKDYVDILSATLSADLKYAIITNSNAITTKSTIFLCNNDEAQFNSSLSIITVTPEEYTAKLINNKI
jgi:hypothetical protein